MCLSSLSIFSPLLFPEFYFRWLLQSGRRWHTQSCNFRCLITTCVLQVCMGRDLINVVVARWLDGKCQRLLATALKVQHCWTLKTTVGDCWRQSPTCAGDSRQLKYKHTRDCRRLSPSRATVGDCQRLKYKPGLSVKVESSPLITVRMGLAVLYGWVIWSPNQLYGWVMQKSRLVLCHIQSKWQHVHGYIHTMHVEH